MSILKRKDSNLEKFPPADTDPVLLKQPAAAILIDCWDDGHPKSPTRHVYNNIVNFLNVNENIRLVILASYESTDIMDPVAIENSQWHRTYFNVRGRRKTSPILLNYTNPNKVLTFAHNYDDLDYFLITQWEHVRMRNIYVMGGDWNLCVQKRQLGINELLNFTLPRISSQVKDSFNILINPECVYEYDFENERLLYPNLANHPDYERVGATGIFKHVSN